MTARRKLKAVRLWMDFRIRRGEPLTEGACTGAVISRFVARICHLEESGLSGQMDRKNPSNVPDPLKQLSDFENWSELVLTYLQHERSLVGHIPLSYLLREHDQVTNEMLAADYQGGIDDELIATAQFDGSHYHGDNQTV